MIAGETTSTTPLAQVEAEHDHESDPDGCHKQHPGPGGEAGHHLEAGGIRRGSGRRPVRAGTALRRSPPRIPGARDRFG